MRKKRDGSRIKSECKGSVYFEVMISLMILFAVIATFLYFPPLFIKKQNIDYMGKKLVRAVEITGMVDDTIESFAQELKDTLGINPTLEWEANYIQGTEKIQIREIFELTLREEYHIKFIYISPDQDIGITIPITSVVTGVSEVYHK